MRERWGRVRAAIHDGVFAMAQEGRRVRARGVQWGPGLPVGCVLRFDRGDRPEGIPRAAATVPDAGRPRIRTWLEYGTRRGKRLRPGMYMWAHARTKMRRLRASDFLIERIMKGGLPAMTDAQRRGALAYLNNLLRACAYSEGKAFEAVLVEGIPRRRCTRSWRSGWRARRRKRRRWERDGARGDPVAGLSAAGARGGGALRALGGFCGTRCATCRRRFAARRRSAGT